MIDSGAPRWSSAVHESNVGVSTTAGPQRCTCSMAWRCWFLTGRSQHGRICIDHDLRTRSSVHRTTDIPSECKHQRQSQWYALWSSGYQDCDEKRRTKFTAKEKGYPNRDAFRIVIGDERPRPRLHWRRATGCLCRVRIASASPRWRCLAGALALSAASFWIYRFDMRPYDDDLTAATWAVVRRGEFGMILGFDVRCRRTRRGARQAAQLAAFLAWLLLRIRVRRRWRRPDARAGTPPYTSGPRCRNRPIDASRASRAASNQS